MLNVLSLGAGVQSTTVMLMSLHAELPPLDHIIFADTGWEPAAVYRQLDWLSGIAAEQGLPLHRVSAGNIRQDALTKRVTAGKRFASMPLYVRKPDGTLGMIRRQCTREYKIDVIQQKLRELIGLRPRQRGPRRPTVRQFFGISFDERIRMRLSDCRWLEFCYPLVERRITRTGCLHWLAARGYPTPPRSACIGCPYHSNAEWRQMKLNRPDEFEDACQFDEAIRHLSGVDGPVFLHRSGVSLRDVDLRNDFDRGQLPLFSGLDDDAAACAASETAANTNSPPGCRVVFSLPLRRLNTSAFSLPFRS